MAEAQVEIAKFCEHAQFCRDSWQAVADQAQCLQVLASTNFRRKFIKIARPEGGTNKSCKTPSKYTSAPDKEKQNTANLFWPTIWSESFWKWSSRLKTFYTFLDAILDHSQSKPCAVYSPLFAKDPESRNSSTPARWKSAMGTGARAWKGQEGMFLCRRFARNQWMGMALEIVSYGLVIWAAEHQIRIRSKQV